MSSSEKPSASKKRKTSSDDESAHTARATIDISSDPKVIADALLSVLPATATDKHAAAKKLTTAFGLVHSELKHRSHVLARNAETTGSKRPFLIAASAVPIPEDVILRILKFLPQNDIVLHASLVSKAWLSATRMPQVWDALILECPFGTKKRVSMTELLALLTRPQFCELKKLKIPRKLKFGKCGVKKLSEHCPLLEELDALEVDTISNANLLSFAQCFSHLSSVRFVLWNATPLGAIQFVQIMGDRLQKLTLKGTAIKDLYRANAKIVEHCPNLKVFEYENFHHAHYYHPHLDGLTETGVIALVRGCKKLRHLNLSFTPNVGLEAFRVVSEMDHSLSTLELSRIKSLATDEARKVCLELEDQIPDCRIDYPSILLAASW